MRRNQPGKWAAVAAFATLATIWACGGKAVIDGPEGNGGASSSNNSSTGSNPICLTPEPVGQLIDCGGSNGAGAGDVTCLSQRCDDDNNVWQSECGGSTCKCLYNNSVQCTCFSDGALCSTAPSCCPDPFPP